MRKREHVSEEEDTGKGGRENRWVKKRIQVKEEESTGELERENR